jgi:hypothetical protein
MVVTTNIRRTEGLGEWRNGNVEAGDPWNVFHSEGTASEILLESDKNRLRRVDRLVFYFIWLRRYPLAMH